jgi:hypothetical protein
MAPQVNPMMAVAEAVSDLFGAIGFAFVVDDHLPALADTLPAFSQNGGYTHRRCPRRQVLPGDGRLSGNARRQHNHRRVTFNTGHIALGQQPPEPRPQVTALTA